jgi:hypothetical protein
MSSFSAETTTLNERKRKEAELAKALGGKSALELYFDRSRPWVLVPNGSIMGYFDWVPEKLRLGPWSPFASAYLVLLCSGVMYLYPGNPLIVESVFGEMNFGNNDQQLHRHPYPPLYSTMWYYNAIIFFWMCFPLYRISRPAGKGGGGIFVMCTYTIQSWTLLVIRHGITALAPFLSPGHILLRINEYLRFPALLSATVTFVVWNFILAPFVCMFAMKDSKKRRAFIKWNFSFNLSQIHFFNIVFAICNTIVGVYEISSSTLEHKLVGFDIWDLWISLLFTFLYVLFYMLVLDRFGVHLYPIFSPRSSWFVCTGTIVLGLIFATYGSWNHLIAHNSYLHYAVGHFTS